jgi:hypothetical protein
MLVQNGPESNPGVLDTYALISFPLSQQESILNTAGSTSRTFEHGVKAKLCLQHVPDASPNAISTTYSLCRINTSGTGTSTLDVDSMNGSNTFYSMPSDCLGGEAMLVDFVVDPEDTEICVDILEALQHPTASLIQTRHLAPEDLAGETVLFMIDNLYTEQEKGDLFYTSNSIDRSPKIVINSSTSGPTFPPQIETQSPTLNVTLLTGQDQENDDKRNGLYSLFLLVLLVPVAWILLRRRSQRQTYDIDGNTMPSQVEIRLSNPEMKDERFGDEIDTLTDQETGKEQPSLCSSNEVGNIETASMLEDRYVFSEDNSSSEERSEEESSESGSSEESTVDWQEDAIKLVI